MTNITKERVTPCPTTDRCSDCPPAGYPTNKTRCYGCPLANTYRDATGELVMPASPTSNERFDVIKQSPRQAGVDDIEWLCDEVEKNREIMARAYMRLQGADVPREPWHWEVSNTLLGRTQPGGLAIPVSADVPTTAPDHLPDETTEQPGPWWTPTLEVERMMRQVKDSGSGTIEIERKVLEGLLHDSLLWRQDRIKQRPMEPKGPVPVGDAFEEVLRVEIASDSPEKVERFRKELANLILDAPAAGNHDVMVTVHAGDSLPVFETNRKPKETKEFRCAVCTKTWDEHKTVITHDFKHKPEKAKGEQT
jgi:hypothetical protein